MTALWTFALVVGLLTVTPGLDTALILRTAAVGHRSRAWGVVLGIQTGTLLWGVLSSVGVTAVLAASRLAYDTLRLAGAAYLLWMGGRMLAATLRRRGDDVSADGAGTFGPPSAVAGDRFGRGWRQGLTTNALNPKIGVFYVSVLPQFIPAHAPHLAFGVLLSCEHVILGTLWSALLIAFAQALRGWLRRPRTRHVLDRVTGTVIVGFGLRLALGD
jgi:threonine/homoserine/homoserine lactone efflux protein